VNKSALAIFASRGFLPLFITQFLGAFNDNLFRQAIIILITFGLAEEMSSSPAVMNNLAIGLFMLPYFLFSAFAGQLADKYEKTGQIIWIKVWEIALMAVGAIGFYMSSLPLLIAVLAGLGLQSTFFGPIKYSILPDLVKKEELVTANAMVEAATFIAILLGLLIGGFVMANEEGRTYISLFTIAIAILGTFTGRMVPKTGQAAPNLKLRINIFASTGEQLKNAWNNTICRRAIMGISWIWLYGSLYIAQMPVIVKNHLGGDETVVTLFMGCFTIGIALGSFLCSKLLKGIISARLAQPALVVLIILSIILYIAIPPAQNITPVPIAAFIVNPVNWPIIAILLATAMGAGVVIVPLYAIVQHNSDRTERSRMIAATNIFNSAFMVGGAGIAAVLISVGFTTPGILLLLGFGNFIIYRIARLLEIALMP